MYRLGWREWGELRTRRNESWREVERFSLVVFSSTDIVKLLGVLYDGNEIVTRNWQAHESVVLQERQYLCARHAGSQNLNYPANQVLEDFLFCSRGFTFFGRHEINKSGIVTSRKTCTCRQKNFMCTHAQTTCILTTRDWRRRCKVHFWLFPAQIGGISGVRQNTSCLPHTRYLHH